MRNNKRWDTRTGLPRSLVDFVFLSAIKKNKFRV